MARYSALLVDQFPLKIDYGAGKPWFRVPVPAQRVAAITNVYTNQIDPGGWVDASFVVPVDIAQRLGLQVFRRRVKVWMFDGGEPIFYGLLDSAVEQANGDYAVTVDGMYKALGMTRMRECWGDGDTTKLTQSPDSSTRGSFTTTARGAVQLGFSQGSPLSPGDSIGCDYFLFGEATGARDAKRITGFDLHAPSGNYQGDPNVSLHIKVHGLTDPNAGGSDLLLDTTSAAPQTWFQDATTNTWPSAVGYRCLRVSLYVQAVSGGGASDGHMTNGSTTLTSAAASFASTDIGATIVVPGAGPSGHDLHTTISSRTSATSVDLATAAGTTVTSAAYTYTDVLLNDRNVTFDRVRVSARAPAIPINHSVSPDIVDLVQDMFDVFPDIYTAPSGLDIHAAFSDPNSEHALLVTGNLSKMGLPMGDVIFDQWSSPKEILESFAAVADARVGMWTPMKQLQNSNGAEASGTRQSWYWRPPQLVFEAWPTTPGWFASQANGAQWQPDASAQTLLSASYVNYTVGTSSKQQQRSVYSEDATQANYAFSENVHEADDFTISPPVGDQVAATLGAQYVQQYRQPALSGTLTVYADRPGCIRSADGAIPARLGAKLRTGIVRVVDAGRWQTGRITQVQYYARDDQGPERAVLTINNPRGLRLNATLARLADREQQRRPR